ncbi:MAG: DUF1467 family protein [Alphaproteobacteria bacterium GM7ARS4]|nr:DUF1467 family protein [Alphaproteobacteria bacterium GM7ARS4]
MNIVSALIVYIVIWWMVFFMLLPWGNAPSSRPMLGHDQGAPANPRVGKKALVTTLVSSFLWVIVYYIITRDLISLS